MKVMCGWILFFHWVSVLNKGKTLVTSTFYQLQLYQLVDTDSYCIAFRLEVCSIQQQHDVVWVEMWRAGAGIIYLYINSHFLHIILYKWKSCIIKQLTNYPLIMVFCISIYLLLQNLISTELKVRSDSIWRFSLNHLSYLNGNMKYVGPHYMVWVNVR